MPNPLRIAERLLPIIVSALVMIGPNAVTAQEKQNNSPKPTELDLELTLQDEVQRQEYQSEDDKEIEKTWRIVEEVRANALRLKLAHARAKDALSSNDCGIAERMLHTLEKSRKSLSRLEKTLQQQCHGVNAATEKNLAEACVDEKQHFARERANIMTQKTKISQMCPSLNN